MQTVAIFLAIGFWLCFGLVTYAYWIYPVLIGVFARLFGRRAEPALLSDDALSLPTVTLLIAAYNEEAVIEERIQNALAMDYPPSRYDIVVASDGSTDATAEIVARHAHRGVRLIDYSRRRGKAAVLNSAIKELNSDILILSDANTQIDRAAARKLIRWFQDPRVGVVCGRLVLTDSKTHRNIDSHYWKYETFLKRCEGRLGALLGANGAIYAIRRELYTPVPNDTIIDDFVIPLRARLRTDCAILYDYDAVAREETAPDFGSEFRRRSRIGAGGFQSIGILWRLLNLQHGWAAFTFLSHKVLRWVCPFLLLGMLVTNALLWNEPLYGWLLLGQVAFYAAALVGLIIPPDHIVSKPPRLCAMFAGMNLALLVGFWRWLRGSQKPAWTRTVRIAEVAEVNGTVP